MAQPLRVLALARRLRLGRAGIALGLLLALGLSTTALIGCSNGAQGASTGTGTTTSTSNAATGTYNFTVYGVDSIHDNINNGISGTAFTLTVQ